MHEEGRFPRLLGTAQPELPHTQTTGDRDIEEEFSAASGGSDRYLALLDIP